MSEIHGGKTRKEGKKNDQPIAAPRVAKRFDTNADGKIDGTEAAALRKAFDRTNHDALKAFDTNKNGKLDDAEITAIHGDKPVKKKNKQN